MQVTDRRYNVILLDMDSTLLDSKLSERPETEHVMRTLGAEPTGERLELYHEINEDFWSVFEWGEVTKERLVWERFNVFFARFGIAIGDHATENLYRRQLDDSTFLVDGTLGLCQYLRKWYNLYAVTNDTSSTQYKWLATSDLNCFMKDIFVSEDTGSQKPQKEYFGHCFRWTPGVCPERMLLVEDSPSPNIEGDQAAGIATC